jgi:hypothetical protein
MWILGGIQKSENFANQLAAQHSFPSPDSRRNSHSCWRLVCEYLKLRSVVCRTPTRIAATSKQLQEESTNTVPRIQPCTKSATSAILYARGRCIYRWLNTVRLAVSEASLDPKSDHARREHRLVVSRSLLEYWQGKRNENNTTTKSGGTISKVW